MRQRNSKWIVILATMLVLWCSLASLTLAADKDTLWEVAGLLKEKYVDPVGNDVLQAPAIDEMLKRLGDPYARYYTREEYQEEMDSLNGEFTGIGVYFRPIKEGAEVFQLLEGSPAARIGIKKGDIITMAAGQALAGLDVDAVSKLIKGAAGTTVQLKIKRGNNTLDMSVVREKVTIPSVESQLLENNTGYISLNEFGKHSAEDMNKAIQTLQAKKAKNWILDLRGNPGGFLDAAIDIAGNFMGEADALIVQERSGKEVYQGNPESRFVDGSLVVLIDENSASAAEILSGALQDNQRALIIGRKSYGKGTVQQIFDLANEDRVKFTIARFYSPLGKTINKVGIQPDIQVSDEEAELAAQLILYDPPADYKGQLIKRVVNTWEINVDPERAHSARFWKAWRSMIQGAAADMLYIGNDTLGWSEISQEEYQSLWPLYYPGYKYYGDLTPVQADGEIKVSLAEELDPRYINFSTVELVKADSGERVKIAASLTGAKDILVKPAAKLGSGEYWLVLHDNIRLRSGDRIDQGQVAVIKAGK